MTDVTPVGMPALCGQEFPSATECLEHTAECHTCHTIAQARRVAQRRPIGRSTIARKQSAGQAANILQEYGRHVSAEPNPDQVLRLGWALAHLERILWLETCGHYGTQHSTSATALERQAYRNPT